ncbi:hypothetical protein [Frankia tisae]|uniref:hypothetical protein n=1 Tax=Frankia tisae TaxID=2950104 RepID=UPI0021C1EAF5|nr:hypothetical protein [Frankia tisae]
MAEAAGAAVLWAIAVLQGPARVVTGTVGPFPTPGAAEGYAQGHRYADWRIVPLVLLPIPVEVAGR